MTLLPRGPRNLPTRSELDLTQGLGAYLGFGYFFLLGPLVPLAMLLFVGDARVPLGGAALSMGVFMAVGLGLLWHGRRQRAARRDTFANGLPVEATVLGRSNSFAFWKSSPNVSIRFRFEFEGRTLTLAQVATDRSVLERLPEGAKVLALYCPTRGMALLGEPFGRRFLLA